MDFYRKTLLPNLTTVTTYSEYVTGQDYSENDVILWYGQLLISTTNNNSTDPCALDTKWTPLKKFTDDLLNVLWDDYLRYYLSFQLAGKSLIYNTYQLGSKGTMKYSEDFRDNSSGLSTVDTKELYGIKKQFLSDAKDILVDMFAFVKEVTDTYDTTLFSEMQYMKDLCAQQCVPETTKSHGSTFHFLK